ncbi:MAG: hypothetical protein M3R14_06550 [Acidobacteriota bacterium]|nr:hypothetical protein [Acidobacteriota bacterium]
MKTMQKINLPINGIGINQPTTLQKTTRLINNVGCFLLQTNKGENFMIMKKMFLALIIAAMTTMATFAQSDENQTQADEASVNSKVSNAGDLTGSWMGVVTAGPGGPPPFRVLVNFTADGGFTGSGDGDVGVTRSGSPQYGVWERIGGRNSRRFALTFLQLYYSNSNSSSQGLGKIRQTIILSRSGDTWQGPGRVDIFAPDGTLVFSGTATATATRIQSEPLP